MFVIQNCLKQIDCLSVIYNLIIALALIGESGNCWKLQRGYKRIWLCPQGYKGFVQRLITNEIK